MIKFIENIGDYYSQHFFTDNFAKKVFDKAGYVTQKKGSDGKKTNNHLSEINALISPLREKYYRFKNDLFSIQRVKDKVRRTHDFHREVLQALGYINGTPEYNQPVYLDDTQVIPVRYNYAKGGKPYLFIMEMKAIVHEGEKAPEGIYDQTWVKDEWEKVFPAAWGPVALNPDVIKDALSELFLLPEDERPVYVVMLAGAKIFLIHFEKWKYDSFLLFDLEELFLESQISANRDYLALFYALLAKPNFLSNTDSLLKSLDEEAHKAAYGVTQNLKKGVIFAVESLANETIWYKKKNIKSAEDKEAIEYLMADEKFAKELKDECLTIVYRLLFLFYAEARADLEILPVKDATYQKGYSLEMLRDLEFVHLGTDSSKEGHFFSISLWKLFDYLHSGVKTSNGFEMKPLDSPLFDNGELKHLLGVQFRNIVLQQIIKRLSLSEQSRGKSRGRISYGNLGINQLGSVYESLLAFNGFFAAETLIEVKAADDSDGKEGTFLVPFSRRDEFKEDEILKEPDNPQYDKQLPKGHFVYRLNGRDRKKSASYYTPEVLTQTTVKYTLNGIIDKLKERQELGEDCADEILNLKILEPAMGAAAFHNEAINQLADAYLELKETEAVRKGRKRIVPGSYNDELQKVKAYIAANNVYGVDLNPTAVELGKLSLWLNCMHCNMETPFFAHRLGVGNAVVGCWLKVYDVEDIIAEYPKEGTTKQRNTLIPKAWWTKAPKRVKWDKKGNLTRKPNQFYHFLLPDDSMMASAGIGLIKSDLNDQERKAIAERKKEFKQPLTSLECKRLEKLCKVIDILLEEHYKQIKKIIKDTTSAYAVYGQNAPQIAIKGYDEKERLAESRNARNAPFYKVRMVMDYWCSLWFWDARNAAEFPSRNEWYNEVENILEVDLSDLRENADVLEILANINKNAASRWTLFDSDTRIQTIATLREQYRFFHHELEFLEVFKEKGGFDVIVGNPPWVIIAYDRLGLLSEIDPLHILRESETTIVDKHIIELLKVNKQFEENLLGHLIESESIKSFVNSNMNYSLLNGQKPNLHKLILENCLELGYHIGLIHDKGIYDDSNGQLLRKNLYRRLEYYFQFQNELKLFQDVGNTKKFELSVCGLEKQTIHFYSINNIFHPNTITESFSNNNNDLLGIRNSLGKWDLRGNSTRIVTIDESILRFYKEFLQDESSFLETKLPVIHSRLLLNGLKKLHGCNEKLVNFSKEVESTIMIDETKGKRLKYLEVNPGFVSNDEFVLASIHYYNGNPIFQTPNDGCSSHRDNSRVELLDIKRDYLPRTVYRLKVSATELNKDPNYYYAQRKRAQTSNERTLITSIQPPFRVHTDNTYSLHFKNEVNMLSFASYSLSIIYDFYVKSTGRENIYFDTVSNLPLKSNPNAFIISRALHLTCITEHYAKLWDSYKHLLPDSDKWSKDDVILKDSLFYSEKSEWNFDIPLKSEYSRRQALIELDVLVSLDLGLDLNELLTIYEVVFGVLQSNEEQLLFDSNGRIVPTSLKKITNNSDSGTINHNGISYIFPFIKVNRKDDYLKAWQHFEKIFSTNTTK